MCVITMPVDVFLLTDQVAGLRESLNMSGHDYNNVLSLTTAGYGSSLELLS